MNENTERAKMMKMITVVRSLEPSANRKLSKQIEARSDDELIDLCFKIRNKRIVLTRTGMKILKACYEHWEITLEKPLSGKQHLLLSRACTLPYYIDDNVIIIFEPEIGVLLKISEGNNKYIENMLG